MMGKNENEPLRGFSVGGKRDMERKMMLGGSSLMAVVALVGLILVGGNSSNGIKPAKGTETDYSIAFDKSTNKIGTDKFVSPSTVYSGSGYATTGLGNKVGFDYSSFANPTTVWQLIKGGGYFTNTDPISGMKSITLTKSNTSSGFQIYCMLKRYPCLR